ncbi:MAG TPA: HipA domain-containing protein, partial [Acetobacteraceae bacterium]|nr:HipA domain-containing protein [Acetobacteraceae bacterium]
KGEIAGTIEETAGGGSRFTYAAGWRDSIACCFPSSRREYEWEQGLDPFFQHLGPEGWLREQQARLGHIAEEDDLGLLLRYGADCIGAVGVRPTGEPLAGRETRFVEATANPGRTISGIQKKLLVVRAGGRFVPADPTGPAPYIAKFNSDRLGTLVRNEALSLRWTAAVLGPAEVNTFTVDAVGSEHALIVTRFDRTEDGGRLRLEDFAQILRKPRGRDYAGKYDSAYEEVAQVIKDYSARPQIDLARLFRRLVVFALVGNCDAHLKNFSLVETESGLRLSPVYDVLNTALYEAYDQRLALAINGRKVQLDTVTRGLLEDFGYGIGLPPQAVTQAFTDLRKKVLNASGILTPPKGEPPEGLIHRFGEIVSGGCLRLLGE